MSNGSNDIWRTVTRIAFSLAVVLILSGLVAAWSAPPEGSDRMMRKMNVLERIFDEVLRGSENVCVSSDSTRGLLLDGYGALFTFEGSLCDGRSGSIAFGKYSRSLSYFSRSKGELYVPAPPPKEPKGDDEDEVRVPESVEALAQNWEEQREEKRQKAKEQLAGLKTELVETLLDYGSTLGELTDDQWVVVAAFLGGFDGDGPEQLVFKVKMRDLRQFNSGQLTLDQAKGRVTIEEK